MSVLSLFLINSLFSYRFYFMQVFEERFEGHDAKIPSLDHRFIQNGHFELIGKILSYAYIVHGYFPINLCRASLTAVMCGVCPDDDLLNKSFRRHMPEHDREFMGRLMADPGLLEGEKTHAIRVFSNYGASVTNP